MSQFLLTALESGEPIPESVEVDAQSLARLFDDLNAMSRDLGLRPLDEFLVDYEEQRMEVLEREDLSDEDLEEAMNRVGDEGPWFDPHEGLRTVHGLIRHLEGLPSSEVDAGKVKVRLFVLKGLESEIGYAKQIGTRFHLAFLG
jgi:hypothetical protein